MFAAVYAPRSASAPRDLFFTSFRGQTGIYAAPLGGTVTSPADERQTPNDAELLGYSTENTSALAA